MSPSKEAVEAACIEYFKPVILDGTFATATLGWDELSDRSRAKFRERMTAALTAAMECEGAEVQRLRRDLQKIVDTDPSYDYDAAEELRNIARAALAKATGQS